MRVFFDARELYFLTQYVPVFRVLEGRGVECCFVAYANRPGEDASIRRTYDRLGLPVTAVGTREDGLALYQREAPDWVVFGRNYGYTAELPEGTRSAMLYHGIGMKTDSFHVGLNAHDVRFIEGDYYVERVRALDPRARLAQVGYPKIDALFRPELETPVDLKALGLDPARPTVLYAPSHAPSSFPNMSDRWPEDLAAFNLIVKAHQLSFFGSRRTSHRHKMELWSRYPNVHVVPIDAFDPVPYMNAADLMVSDVSAVLFEFAATGKPVLWCDFVHYPWNRRGLFTYRRWRRVDRETIERYHDIAVHVPRYAALRGEVERALADPTPGAEHRRRLAEELVGPLDGRSSERVADTLMGVGSPARLAEPPPPAASGVSRAFSG